MRKEYTTVAKYIAIATAVFMVLYFGGRGIIGFVIYSPTTDLTLDVGQGFSQDETYYSDLESFGLLKGVSLEGSFTGNGKAMVYLEIGNQSLLVLDTSEVQPAAEDETTTPAENETTPMPSLLTGYVVSEESESQPASEASEEPSAPSDESGGAAADSPSEAPAAESASEPEEPATSGDVVAETPAETTSEPITSETPAEITETSVEDTPPTEQPAETTTTVEEELPEPPFETPVDVSGNDTQDNIAIEEPQINDTNTTEETTTTIETNATVNQTGNTSTSFIPTTTIPEEGPGIEIPIIPKVSFDEACTETCSLNVNATGIKLSIKIIGGGEFYLDKIHYQFSKMVQVIEPSQVKEIPDIIIEQNKSFSLILSDYFTGSNLSYTFEVPEHIKIKVDGGKAFFNPDQGFLGSEGAAFYASNAKGALRSNDFNIRVEVFKEEELLSRFVGLFPYLSFIEVTEAGKLFTIVYEINNTIVRVKGVQNATDLSNITVGDIGDIEVNI